MKRILHLYSNHKWTGPADHALNLTRWLGMQSDAQAYFACGRRRGTQNQLYRKANEQNLAYVDGLFLNKHLHGRMIPDIFSLKKLVAAQHIDVIHSHQDNDALTAVLAGFGPRLIRTWYAGEPAPLNSRQHYALRRTAKVMAASRRVQAHLADLFRGKDIEQVDIPVDLQRFQPFAKNEALCRQFGLTTGEPVAGIVARVQKHRNFTLLLDAIEAVVKEIPQFKFLIVGRGTHIDALARRPAEHRGLGKSVIFTGYREDDYRDVLNLFDFKIFLTPGSDGACRAVREALACGKPVIASRQGILPELVQDGTTGLLIDLQTADLVHSMLTLIRESDFRLRCAHAARQYAEHILSPARYLQKVVACYHSMGADIRLRP